MMQGAMREQERGAGRSVLTPPCPALREFLAADKKGGGSVRGVHTEVHDPNRNPA